jgi:hypothetical protein
VDDIEEDAESSDVESVMEVDQDSDSEDEKDKSVLLTW